MTEFHPNLENGIDVTLKYITEYLREEIHVAFSKMNPTEREKYIRDLVVLFEEDQIDFILNRN